MVIHYDKYPILQFFNKELLPKLNGKINIRGEDIQTWNTYPYAAHTARYVLNEMYKGYIADKLKEYLVSQNVKSAIISLGGNIVVIGNKPDGSEYNIGIKDPNNSGDIIRSLKVSDKSEYKFLAVIFTYVLFDGDRDAMRFAWNMAENYVTEYDTFVTYCKRAGEICVFKRDKNCTFYQTISSIEFVGNTSDQMKEEVAKAKQILYGAPRSDGKTWEKIIIEAEKYAFFKGTIRFLFQNAEIWTN